jgi:hypothetical protein
MNEENEIETKNVDKLANKLSNIINRHVYPDGIPGIQNRIHDHFQEIIISSEILLKEVQQIDTERRNAFEKQTEKIRNAELDISDGQKIEPDEFLAFITDLTINVVNSMKKFRRLYTVNLSNILIRSLFLNLFSIFDSFVSDLLKEIYKKKPELIENINQNFSVRDLKEYASIDIIINQLINKDIEQVLRESYIEQFSIIGTKFKVKLTEFKNWPAFVEITQRRNLIMHTNGRVTNQYLENCKNNQCTQTDSVKINDTLHISKDYLLVSASILQEVTFKLSITLWRKIFPNELEMSDKYANNHLFSLLIEEDYMLAANLGEFMVRQNKFFSDIDKRIILINYCIALKGLNKIKELNTELDSIDWSSSILDFKLAVELLKDNHKEFLKLMEKIGINGEYITEESYKEWPLFRHIRNNSEFQQKYKLIFNKDIEEEIKKVASDIIATDSFKN